MTHCATFDTSLAQDIIGWDIRNWSQALKWWDERLPDSLDGHQALEIGCANNGGLALWLGLKGCQVTCQNLIDRFDSVRPIHAQYGVEELMKYDVIDASKTPVIEQYDIIIFKSVLGAIIAHSEDCEDESQAASKIFKRLYDSLKPGGKLLFAENLRASRLHQVLRNAYNDWRDRWCYPDLEMLNHGLRFFDHVDIKSTGVLGTFGRTEWQRDLLARVDQGFLNYFTPEDSRYIAFVYAEKAKSAVPSDFKSHIAVNMA